MSTLDAYTEQTSTRQVSLSHLLLRKCDAGLNKTDDSTNIKHAGQGTAVKCSGGTSDSHAISLWAGEMCMTSRFSLISLQVLLLSVPLKQKI